MKLMANPLQLALLFYFALMSVEIIRTVAL